VKGDRARRARSDSGRAENNAAAWAAAAVVLSLGALGFGVAAQVRITNLEHQLDRIEAAAGSRVSTTHAVTTTTKSTTTVADDGAGDPASGGQPLDPESARESVMHAFQTVYDGSAAADNRLAFIDDSTGVAPAFAAAAAGSLAGSAPAMKARVDGVTFTSATEASVRYTVVANGTPVFANRVGTARFENGVWKVTRATVCGDLAQAGANCG
jgi:hypothetical protein